MLSLSPPGCTYAASCSFSFLMWLFLKNTTNQQSKTRLKATTKKEKETFKTRFYLLIHHTAMTIPLKHTYMRDETGGMRQTTITVTDSSPFYGGSTGEWDGAYVTDSNEYYAWFCKMRIKYCRTFEHSQWLSVILILVGGRFDCHLG